MYAQKTKQLQAGEATIGNGWLDWFDKKTALQECTSSNVFACTNWRCEDERVRPIFQLFSLTVPSVDSSTYYVLYTCKTNCTGGYHDLNLLPLFNYICNWNIESSVCINCSCSVWTLLYKIYASLSAYSSNQQYMMLRSGKL